MQRLTIDVQFVTPCFLGGADPKQNAEWRAESIRGQLRWWFRAVAARDFGFDIKRIREAEEAVWGSTTRKSAVGIIVEPLKPSAVETAHVKFMDTVEGSGKGSINGPVYLGYGLFETAGPPGGKFFQTARPFIKPAETARFHLVRPRGDDDLRDRRASRMARSRWHRLSIEAWIRVTGSRQSSWCQ
jgi:hypothetical protein